MDGFFFATEPLEDGRVGGGRQKLQYIRRGWPGVELYIRPDNTPTVLATLLSSLYLLLKEHYGATDVHTLARFLVPLRGSSGYHTAGFFAGPRPIVVPDLPRGRVQGPQPEKDALAAIIKAALENISPSPSRKPGTTLTERPPRALDNHAKMALTFKAIFLYSTTGSDLRKTPDQFLGLRKNEALKSWGSSSASETWSEQSNLSMTGSTRQGTVRSI